MDASLEGFPARLPPSIPEAAVCIGKITVNGKKQSVYVLVTDGDLPAARQVNATEFTAQRLTLLFNDIVRRHAVLQENTVLSANRESLTLKSKVSHQKFPHVHKPDNGTRKAWDTFERAVLENAGGELAHARHEPVRHTTPPPTTLTDEFSGEEELDRLSSPRTRRPSIERDLSSSTRRHSRAELEPSRRRAHSGEELESSSRRSHSRGDMEGHVVTPTPYRHMAPSSMFVRPTFLDSSLDEEDLPPVLATVSRSPPLEERHPHVVTSHMPHHPPVRPEDEEESHVHMSPSDSRATARRRAAQRHRTLEAKDGHLDAASQSERKARLLRAAKREREESEAQRRMLVRSRATPHLAPVSDTHTHAVDEESKALFGPRERHRVTSKTARLTGKTTVGSDD